jgi:hypothetical protein
LPRVNLSRSSPATADVGYDADSDEWLASSTLKNKIVRCPV